MKDRKFDYNKMTDCNWDELRESLPIEKTAEGLQKRKELWKAMDVNGNGIMSLAEVDKGLRDNIKLDSLFDSKPVIIRAFNAAKDKGKHVSKYSADYVEKNEFRYLLVYLRQFAEYFVMFNRLDTGHDKKISFQEFERGLDECKKWGLKVEDARTTFDEIDTNHGGSILFIEFADFAMKNHLDLEDDDDMDMDDK